MKEFFLKILITLGFLSPAAPAVVNTTPTQISATSTISTTTVSSPKIISENNTPLYNKDSKGEVKKEVQVTPKVAPVTPVKEEVKKEPVKEVVQEVKAEPVQEVKENPFGVVKWTFDFGMERVENLYIKEWNVKVYAQAYHRQGTLATVNKCQYYTRADGKTKNSAEAEVTKEMGNDYISFRAYADQDLKVRTFVKCYAFTNNGGDITYGESDWIEVK